MRLFITHMMLPLLAISLFATAAAAQEREERELPPPLVEREEDPAKEDNRSGSANEKGDELTWPPISPSVSLMGHLGFIDDDFDLPGYGLWLGANYYPWPDRHTMFWSAGFKIERNQELRDRPYAFVPTVRSGFAWLKGDPLRFKNQLFANLQVYGFVGRHIGAGELPPFWRVGLGVMSPRLAPANAAMLLWGIPLPNQLEVAFDTLPDGSQRELLVLLGIGL